MKEKSEEKKTNNNTQGKQKMFNKSHSPNETTTTTTAAALTATSSSQPLPPLSVPLECSSLQQQHQQAAPKQKSRFTKERSNRHKILTKDGTARFGTIYNACPLPHKATRPIHLTKCTAIRDIKKSATAKKNKAKIVRAGESVYVLGDPVSGSKGEVFVFKEGCGGCVYKRVWEAVKEDLRVCGDVVVTVSVEAEGVAGKEEEGRWLQVELGRSKEADVWVSERWWDTKMKTMATRDNKEEEEDKDKSEEEGICCGYHGEDEEDGRCDATMNEGFMYSS